MFAVIHFMNVPFCFLTDGGVKALMCPVSSLIGCFLFASCVQTGEFQPCKDRKNLLFAESEFYYFHVDHR